MTKPLSPIAALILVFSLFCIHPSFAANKPKDPFFDKALAEQMERLRTAYLGAKPVEKAITESDLTELERPKGAPSIEAAKWVGVERMARIRDLAKLVAAASIVQVQTDPAIKKSSEFQENLSAIARKMKLTPQQTKMAEMLYGDPDLAPKPPETPEERQKLEEERAAVRKMLQNASGDNRRNLSRKLNNLNLKLWDKPEFDLDLPQLAGFGIVAGPNGNIRKDVDYAALNAQANGGPNTLKMVAVPIPQGAANSLTKTEARYQQIYQSQLAKENAVKEAARKETENMRGAGLLKPNEAYDYWDRLDDQADEEGGFWGFAKELVAKPAKGLIWVSGLREVETSAAQAGYLGVSDDVRDSEKKWALAKLGGNSALSFLTFLPAVGFAGQLGKGGQAAKLTPVFSRGGQAIKGIGAAGPEATQAIKSAGNQMKGIIDDVLPKGTPPNKQQLQALFTEMNENVGKKYGLSIEVGGTTGESVTKGNKILASLDAGAPHESLHALQQLKTRVAFLEREATRLGKSVDELSEAQRALAMRNAEAFEKAAYAQHEMQAKYATRWGGSGKQEYARYLSQSMDDLGVALQNGTVIKGSYGAGAQMYGRFGAAMGDSQKTLATNMASSGIVFTKVTNEFLAELTR